MTQLSEQTSGFKDSLGKFHGDKEKADMASAQDLLNKANPGGSVSVQSIINLYVQNPELWDMVNVLYSNRRALVEKQRQEQAGIPTITAPEVI